MRLRSLALLLAAMVTGCLQEGHPVDGRQLFAGRSVDKPSFLTVDNVAHVMFQVGTAPASPTRAATYDLWLANYESGVSRRLLANVADRDSWRPQADSKGVRYMMVDEHPVDAGSAIGATTNAGTLVRFSLVNGELERVPEVSAFSVHAPTGQFFYRRVTAGSRLPELFLRTSEGTDRSLGFSAGAAELVGPDRAYFVSGEDRVFSRITSAQGAVEVIHANVSRFLLSDDEQWAVVQTTKQGKPTTVVVKVNDPAQSERALPGSNPCCWMGFAGDEFSYSESADGVMPAKTHAFNVVTGADRTVTLPVGLSDLSGVIARPSSSQSLYVDSRGRLALVPNGDPASGRVLDARPASPSFTNDGRFLVYVDPEPNEMGEGHLMVQDADLAQPPRTISPPGSLVPPRGYFFINEGVRRILVFWAHIGRSASDLYFANHETGDLSVVVRGISQVTVTARRVFGIVRVSEQDLVGELVNKDLVMQHEIVLAHAVSDAAVAGNKVAFVIRDRIASPRDGLWAIPSDGISGMMTVASP